MRCESLGAGRTESACYVSRYAGIRAIGKQGPAGKNSRQKKAFKQEEYPRGGRTESARMAETRIRRISPGKDTRPARRRTARIPALKGPKGLYRTGMAKQGWHHVETPRPCIRHPLYPETGVFYMEHDLRKFMRDIEFWAHQVEIRRTRAFANYKIGQEQKIRKK